MPPHSLTYKVSQIISNDWIDPLENYFLNARTAPGHFSKRLLRIHLF